MHAKFCHLSSILIHRSSVSMSDRLYFDWNATAPLREEARAAVLSALNVLGNPSSVHAEGRAARRLIERAREEVATLVATEPRNVVFTSGGTEANALALTPVPQATRPARLLISAIEHTSVLAGGRFVASQIEKLPVRPTGLVDLDDLERRLAANTESTLVSIMLANNETGVVQPISEIAALVHHAGATLHVDAVQGPGRIACNINEIGADLLSISGHKIGGPTGTGALIRRDARTPFPNPLIRGGGQERGLRAGTENVAGIAGFGAAAAALAKERLSKAENILRLRQRLESGLKNHSAETVIFGDCVARLPNSTLFAIPGVKAETAVIALDLEGVAVSSGAACSSGKVQASHVLAAMGVPELLARGAIRVSLGSTTSESDVDRFIGAWIKVSDTLLKVSKAAAA
jgi:cysteine desulfurase